MNNEAVAIRAINIAKELGFNKKYISEKTNLSTTIISRISKGIRQTSREEVELIANSVGLDLDILYNEDCTNFKKYNWFLSQKNGKFLVAKEWPDILFPIINREYEKFPKKKYYQVMNYAFATKLIVLLGSQYKYYEIYTKSNAENETDENYGGGFLFADYPCALIEHKTKNGFALNMGYWFPRGILNWDTDEQEICCIVQAICLSYDKKIIQDGTEMHSKINSYCQETQETDLEIMFDNLEDNAKKAMGIDSNFQLYAPSLCSSNICYNLIKISMDKLESNNFGELDKKFSEMFELYKAIINDVFKERYDDTPLIKEPDNNSTDEETDFQGESSNKTKKQAKSLYAYCIKCGAKFPEQAIYCPGCGAKRGYY